MSQPEAPPHLLGIEEHLCFQLYTASLKMTQIYKPLLAEFNLTYPQYLVMLILWEGDGLGIKDVAQRMQQDSGSITPIVKRLEAEGYLLRSRDPRDERNVLLTLTVAGQDLRASGLRINQEFDRICAILQKDTDAMMEGIQRLNKTLMR